MCSPYAFFSSRRLTNSAEGLLLNIIHSAPIWLFEYVSSGVTETHFLTLWNPDDAVTIHGQEPRKQNCGHFLGGGDAYSPALANGESKLVYVEKGG